jgi:hypothetical protein
LKPRTSTAPSGIAATAGCGEGLRISSEITMCGAELISVSIRSFFWYVGDQPQLAA